MTKLNGTTQREPKTVFTCRKGFGTQAISQYAGRQNQTDSRQGQGQGNQQIIKLGTTLERLTQGTETNWHWGRGKSE